MYRSLYSQITGEPPPKKRRKWPLILAATVLCLATLVITSLGWSQEDLGETPAPPVISAAASTPAPTPSPTPAVTPPPAVLDVSRPVPQGEPVGMDYFADALFIGDSRTQGLQLYSGIQGATFYAATGLSIFGVNTPGVVTVNGKACSIAEALAQGPQFGKVYIAFGLNELGYYNTEYYLQCYRTFLEQVKTLQPNAVIYLQTLAPVNEEKCAQWGQASCITNQRVRMFNELFAQLALECKVALVDVHAALAEADGSVPLEATVDGIHFQKPWYETWLTYLCNHTVDLTAYQQAQTD